MKVNLPPIIFAIIFLALVPKLQGQTKKSLYFHKIEGLTSKSENSYIYRDNKGFVWISSIDGLNRFDGHHIKKYFPNPNKATSLADANIHSTFYEDEENNLWFTTNTAIHKYIRQADHFERFMLSPNSSPAEYQILFRDGTRRELWVRNKDELFLFSEQYGKVVSRLGVFPMHFKCTVYASPINGNFFLLVPSQNTTKLYQFDRAQLIDEMDVWENDPRNQSQIFSGFRDTEEKIWIGSSDAVKVVGRQIGTKNSFTESYRIPIKQVDHIVAFQQNQLLLSSRGTGLFIYDSNKRKITTELLYEEDGVSKSFTSPIEGIHIDKDSTLWIGIEGEGVLFTNLRKRKFQSLLFGQLESPVSSITQHQDGQIWCSTTNRIWRGHPKDGVFDEVSPLPFSSIYKLYYDSNDNLWVCTGSGLFVLPANRTRFTRVKIPAKHVRFPGFTYITELQDKTLLASSQFYGVQQIWQDSTRNFRMQAFHPELGNEEVFTLLFEDSRGNLYICTHNAYIHILQKEDHSWQKDTSIAFTPMINGIVEDPVGNKVWLATSAGLFTLFANAQQEFVLNKSEEFSYRPLKGLLRDTLNNIWISSNEGLIRYKPENHQASLFSLADGLQANEFNFWSYLETKEDNFLFGGINGINSFNPYQINFIQTQAHPTIVEILINGSSKGVNAYSKAPTRNISEISSLILPYTQRQLSFRFAALEYSDPQAVKYQCQMLGLDENPVDLGIDNFISYGSMPHGSYTLSVSASNSDGIMSEEKAMLDIKILPPFYATWWFQILGLIAVSTFLYTLYRNRIKQIRKRESFRQKEAEYKQLVAETETAILRLQMNPHFLFNSMNSINSYILQKDIDTASHYLTLFAKLMRQILELSEHPYIEILEEVDFLKLYLEAESMRMGRKLHFSFYIDPSIDTDEVLIPTMLLQPFVENAIWHGISPRKKEGLINIRFLLQENALLCEVEDNGVGRGSGVVTSKEHKSKALDITRRRLHLLPEGKGQKAKLQIIDLKDEHGQAIGTKVEVLLPLL